MLQCVKPKQCINLWDPNSASMLEEANSASMFETETVHQCLKPKQCETQTVYKCVKPKHCMEVWDQIIASVYEKWAVCHNVWNQKVQKFHHYVKPKYSIWNPKQCLKVCSRHRFKRFGQLCLKPKQYINVWSPNSASMFEKANSAWKCET